MSFTVHLITDEGTFEHENITLIAELFSGQLMMEGTDHRPQLSSIKRIHVSWTKES